MPECHPIFFSIVIPIYKNADGIRALLDALSVLEFSGEGVEVVFVVDGSPDNSFDVLRSALPGFKFRWQLLELNQGAPPKSFSVW